MIDREEYVHLGRITRSHGLRGQVVLDALPGIEDSLHDLERVWILGDAARELKLERLHHAGRSLVLGFAGVSRREESDLLRGTDLWALRSEFALPEGQIAVEDLIGIAVRLENGAPLGALADVWQTGANDVYVVRSATEEWLLPATDAVVRSLDVEGRVAVVRLMPGLEPTPLKPPAPEPGPEPAPGAPQEAGADAPPDDEC